MVRNCIRCGNPTTQHFNNHGEEKEADYCDFCDVEFRKLKAETKEIEEKNYNAIIKSEAETSREYFNEKFHLPLPTRVTGAYLSGIYEPEKKQLEAGQFLN
jgi:hypothetical protein